VQINLKSIFTQNVRLDNGTEQWDRWVELPIPLDFKVYFFNVTNVEAVQNGEQPIVEEVGPYVYS
jgi:lysosome membrane protein 2